MNDSSRLEPMLKEVLAGAFPLDDGSSRRMLPEPSVKQLLHACGVSVPAGATADRPAGLQLAARALRAPLVLKAYGAGIVHKSDVGAVQLGLTHESLAAAAEEMTARLAENGISPPGFLVEEQQDSGVEIILGIDSAYAGIPVVMLGLGGVYAEVLASSTMWLCPVTEGEARELIEEFRGSGMLKAGRGRSAVDRDALLRTIMAIAGEDGLATRLAARGLAELECNPIIATPHGVVAVDARLILQAPRETLVERAKTDFDMLFKPRSIAVAGVSARPGGLKIGNRALAACRKIGWSGNLYALHPSATEIDGVPAFRSLEDVPGGYVDYLKVLVSATGTVELIRSCAGRVGIAQVISGGFGEMGTEGRSLEHELLAAARESRVRVVGPNCLGVYCPAGKQSFRVGDPPIEGVVGMIMQSGGLSGDIMATGMARGLRFSKVVSIGNAIDVTLAEMLEFLVNDPETEVIGIYMEGFGDGSRLVENLRQARGRKPAVALMGGITAPGAVAAASHTGAMMGDDRLIEAICRSTGLFRVNTLEDLVGSLLMHQRYAKVRTPALPGLVIIGNGGGASTLCADAAARAGVSLPQFSNAAALSLQGIDTGVPKILCNPLEVITNWLVPNSPTDGPRRVLEALRDVQPFSDAIVHMSMATYYSYGEMAIDPLLDMIRHLGAIAGKPWRIAFVARNSDVIPPSHLDVLRSAAQEMGVPLYPTIEAALVATAAAQAFSAGMSDN